MGRGWAKGLTALSDSRVARAAGAHRGMRYTRRKPVEEDRRCSRTWREIFWTEDLAYGVGLIATDGGLVGRGAIAFKSKDVQLINTYLAVMGRRAKPYLVRGGGGSLTYHVQFGDVVLYRWLEAIGLSPRKSLVLGAIDVPPQFFYPLARGLLDGDGTIAHYIHRPTKRHHPTYRYERLVVKFHSASRAHIEWLRSEFATRGVTGALVVERRRGKTPMHVLQLGKKAAETLLPRLYPSSTAPKLERKWLVWHDYLVGQTVPTVGFEPTTLTS